MTFNTIFKKMTFLNTHAPFNGNMFELWKVRFKIYIQSFDLELWETIINSLFIPTHHINNEVVDKSDFLLTKEEKRKFKIDFKTKNFLVVFLEENQFFYVHTCNSAKEMCDTYEMIYGVSSSIKQERMNTRDDEDEFFFHKSFSILRKFSNNIKTLVAKKYLKIKNWD